MKFFALLISLLTTIAVVLAASGDIDIVRLRSMDHTSIWTPPSVSTTLVGTDTADNLSNKTFTKFVSTSEQVNAASTGSNSVVSSPTSSIVKLTNASLVSIDGIAAPPGNQILILKNYVGASITVNNDTGATLAARIKTGTGSNLVLANEASVVLVYSTTDSRWQVVGGSGSGGGGISNWITATAYVTNNVVIQSNKIYQAQSDHTSGTFATDLAGGKWLEISATDVTTVTGTLPIANGGTGSTTRNFVDLSSSESISGTKTFNSTIVGSISGNAATATTVTTNANLTGPITSVGNATSIASQTGTGSTFVMSAAPTITGHPTVEGVTATGATGTGKFVFDAAPTITGHPTIEGVTATGAVGTGKLVFDSSPTFTLNIAVGTTRNDAMGINLFTTLNSAATQYGLFSNPTFRENTLTAGTAVYAKVTSGNPAYALPDAFALEAAAATKGTSSTITNSTGLMLRDQTIGTSSNYGIQNQVSAGTNKWAYYGSGTGNNYFGGPVSISTTGNSAPNANAVLDVTSTTKAFMPPRMTTTQKLAIASPTAGMVVYDSTLGAQSTYDGTSWQTGLGTITVDTDWTACTFSTLAWQGLGTVTNTSLQCRRQGPNLEMKGTVTTGTVTASLVQVLLPSNYGTIVTQSPGSAESYGTLLRNVAGSTTILNAISTVGLGYFQVSAPMAATNNPATAVGGTSASGTGEVLEFQNIKIPISGWSSNSSTFSGGNAGVDPTSYTPTLANLGTTSPTTNQCKYEIVGGNMFVRCFFTAGTVSGGVSSLSLPSGFTIDTTKLISTATTAGPTQAVGTWSNNGANLYGQMLVFPGTSSTLIYFGAGTTSTGLLAAQSASPYPTSSVAVTLEFKVPLVGKSNISQVVANISGYGQVPGISGSATPNVDHIMQSFGATISTVCTAANTLCAYNDGLGTSAPITKNASTGLYTIAYPKTYSKAKCTFSGVASGGFPSSITVSSCSNCASMQFTTWNTSTGGAADSYGTIDCYGVY